MNVSALYIESAEAFAELSEVISGSTITFNGITRPCVSSTINIKRAQQLQGYQLDSSSQVVMLVSDFEDFEGITDRVSKVQVNDGDELVLLTKDVHPNSATVTLFLGSAK